MPEEHIESDPDDPRGEMYRSYLLRCRREPLDREPVWRFTLVHIDDDQKKKGFASLEDVFTYIRDDLDHIR